MAFCPRMVCPIPAGPRAPDLESERPRQGCQGRACNHTTRKPPENESLAVDGVLNQRHLHFHLWNHSSFEYRVRSPSFQNSGQPLQAANAKSFHMSSNLTCGMACLSRLCAGNEHPRPGFRAPGCLARADAATHSFQERARETIRREMWLSIRLRTSTLTRPGLLFIAATGWQGSWRCIGGFL